MVIVGVFATPEKMAGPARAKSKATAKSKPKAQAKSKWWKDFGKRLREKDFGKRRVYMGAHGVDEGKSCCFLGRGTFALC